MFSTQAAEINTNEILILRKRISELEERNIELTQQVEWFKRQLLGEKSEKLLP